MIVLLYWEQVVIKTEFGQEQVLKGEWPYLYYGWRLRIKIRFQRIGMQAVYFQSATPDARESNSHYGVIVKYPVQ